MLIAFKLFNFKPITLHRIHVSIFPSPSTGSHDTNLINAAADMAVYAMDRKWEKEANRQRREGERQLVELRGPLCAFRFSRDGTVMNLFNSFESMVELAKGL